MKKLAIIVLALSFALPSVTAACSVLSQTACPQVGSKTPISIPNNPGVTPADHVAATAGGRNACPWNRSIGARNIDCHAPTLSDSQFSLLVQWLMGK